MFIYYIYIHYSCISYAHFYAHAFTHIIFILPFKNKATQILYIKLKWLSYIQCIQIQIQHKPKSKIFFFLYFLSYLWFPSPLSLSCINLKIFYIFCSYTLFTYNTNIFYLMFCSIIFFDVDFASFISYIYMSTLLDLLLLCSFLYFSLIYLRKWMNFILIRPLFLINYIFLKKYWYIFNRF